MIIILFALWMVIRMFVDIFRGVKAIINPTPLTASERQQILNPEPFFGRRGRDGRRH
jgi:hypothetical protein